MRPVHRGPSPQPTDFEDYRDAFPHLIGRLGLYCSYCERRIPANLAVEHIQPKGLPQYIGLVGRWDNFLLGCVNCNGTKTNKDVILTDLLMPDRDNTAHAYIYTPDGKVVPSTWLTAAQRQMATKTLALCGLDKAPSEMTDENGRIVAADRIAQRVEVWAIALICRDDLTTAPTDGMRRAIVSAAIGHGFFSIWTTVFSSDTKMLHLLIHGFTIAGAFVGFPGTATDCYDPTGRTVSPRPGNGLAHGSKT